ncbi:MAG: hypothetical protein HKM98_04605 [Gammaproteobacteria bacterium]|nr:hypothetical protein [Gammaproteobacteria bacterium]
MLQSIRDNLNGWVVWLLFIVIALAFALWGVPSTVTGNTAPAEVNGEEIPLNEIRRAYRNQLLQFQQFSDVTPEQEKAIQAQVLQGLVMDEVIAQHTREAGYHIGNEALVGHIRNMTEFQDEGQFSMELFQNRLIPQGLSVQYFEAQVRRALRISQLRRGIIDTAFVTDEELTHRIRLEREQRNAEWLRLKVDPAAENLEVSEEEIVAYYESNQSRFMRPESVDLQFVVLNLGDLAAETTVSDEDLQEYYDKEVEQGRFQAPEEREASHVLIAVDGDTSDDQASAKAQELLAQINDGADFAAIAKEHSDDPGSGPEGGSLGWSPREAYVGPFADALFSMTAGEVRGPIRTQFGYHIILMQDQRGGIAKPFAEVKAELLSELSRSRAEDEYYSIAEEMADLAFENPSTLDPIVTELGLELQTASSVTRTAQPEVLAVPAIIDAAFSERVLEQRENSDLIDTGADSRVILRVANFNPSTVRPLTEVRDEIRVVLLAEAARDLSIERGKALAERIRAGEAMADVAEASGAEYNAAEPYRRSSDLPPQLREALFKAPKPGADSSTVESLSIDDGSYVIFALNEVIPGDASNPGDSATIASQQGIGDLSAYILQLRDDASIQLRPELLQQ